MPTRFVNSACFGLLLAASVARGQACVSGRVLAEDSDRPIAKATISAAWTEFRADKKRGAGPVRMARDTTSDTAGHFAFCLTPGASALVQVTHGQANAYVPVSVARTDTAVVVHLGTGDDNEHATVAGRVVSETGSPVAKAAITVLGVSGTTRTGNDGTFQVKDLPAGSQILIARSIGLGAAAISVNLSATTPTQVDVTMQRLPPTLEVVDVVADRLQLASVYRDIGFTQRQRIGNGKFMTYEQIRARSVNDVAELFRGVPGVRVVDDHHGVLKVYPNRGPNTIYGYGDCTAYVIDGTLIGNGKSTDFPMPSTNEPPGGPDELLLPAPEELIAVEVYQPSEPAPTPLSGPAMRCLKVLLWTKAQLAGR